MKNNPLRSIVLEIRLNAVDSRLQNFRPPNGDAVLACAQFRIRLGVGGDQETDGGKGIFRVLHYSVNKTIHIKESFKWNNFLLDKRKNII